MDKRIAGPAAALVAALAVIASVQAGSQDATFTTFVAPTPVTTGATGLAGAKFTPTGIGNNGSATHVVITLVFPAGTTGITVTACPGSSSVHSSTRTATCRINSVHKGVTAKMFVTFTAGASSGNVEGTVKFDVPAGGSATGSSTTPKTSTSPLKIASETFAGACSFLASDHLSAADPGVGKSTFLTFGQVDASLGFPCTPAVAGVDPSITIHGFTPGIWTVVVPPLANHAPARAVLTLAHLPSGASWETFQIFELDPTTNLPLPSPVPACTDHAAASSDSCIFDRAPFGDAGVALSLNVQGSFIDPSYTG